MVTITIHRPYSDLRTCTDPEHCIRMRRVLSPFPSCKFQRGTPLLSPFSYWLTRPEVLVGPVDTGRPRLQLARDLHRHEDLPILRSQAL